MSASPTVAFSTRRDDLEDPDVLSRSVPALADLLNAPVGRDGLAVTLRASSPEVI